jgi:hypothetical protein
MSGVLRDLLAVLVYFVTLLFKAVRFLFFILLPPALPYLCP